MERGETGRLQRVADQVWCDLFAEAPAEGADAPLSLLDGRPDRKGLGLFARLGFADHRTRIPSSSPSASASEDGAASQDAMTTSSGSGTSTTTCRPTAFPRSSGHGTAIRASRPSTTSSSHEAKEKTVDGSKYYVSGDAYYQQVSNGGKNIYMVVTDPTKSA